MKKIKKIVINFILLIMLILSIHSVVMAVVYTDGQITKAQPTFSFIGIPWSSPNNPINGDTFNRSPHFFCAEHNVPYAKAKNDTLGSGYHHSVDLTNIIYVTSTGAIVPSSRYSTQTGFYKDSNESPSQTTWSNFIYKKNPQYYGCSHCGQNSGGFAFLLARYKYNGSSRIYSDDPLQRAVWAYLGQLGGTESNPLEYARTQYESYHTTATTNPNVSAETLEDVGTVLNGSNFNVGKFKMSKYVRAKDYDCATSTSSTTPSYSNLQQAFGASSNLQGTVIQATAILNNGTRVEFPVPEPNAEFSINITPAQRGTADAVEKLEFVYQRIHSKGQGEHYEGHQAVTTWSEKSQTTGCRSYSCQQSYGYCSERRSPGTTSVPHSGCTHTGYVGCWTEYGYHGSHTSTYTNADGSTSSYTYSCSCSRHIHGSSVSSYHGDPYLCRHGHKDCREFVYQGTVSDIAQDGLEAYGELWADVKIYTINVNVPMTTDVSVSKYITEVKHADGSLLEDWHAQKNRKDMTEPAKAADKVKIENGDEVTYKIVVENKSRFNVKVKIKDTLPTSISSSSITPNLTGWTSESAWITINANSKVEYAVKVVANAPSGEYYNTMELVTKNGGARNMYIQYTGPAPYNKYKSPYTSGPVVNINPKISDKDWYKIKEYNVNIDKYIAAVEHSKPSQSLIPVQNEGRSVQSLGNTAETKKKADPVYVENGDLITYHIDIYNTTLEYPKGSVKNRKDNPWYEPDKIYVKVKDLFPPYFEIVQNIPTEVEVAAGEMKRVVVKVRVKDPDLTKNPEKWENNASFERILNLNRKNIKNNSDKDTSSDWHIFKTFNINADKYIYDVEHDRENIDNSGLIDNLNTTIGATEERRVTRGVTENAKKNSPVYVEFGDIVTYRIDIYNTKPEYPSGLDRTADPYHEPDKAYVCFEDKLPNKYNKDRVTVKIPTSGTYTVNDAEKKIEFKDVEVPLNGKTTIEITLVVEEYEKGTIEENNAKFLKYDNDTYKMTNINKKQLRNKCEKDNTSDWYKLNDYNLSVNKYVSAYNAEVMDWNNINGFLNNEKSSIPEEKEIISRDGFLGYEDFNKSDTQSDREDLSRVNLSEAERKEKAVPVEKNEKVIYSLVYKNEATASGGSLSTGKKPATQVRTTEVQEILPADLKLLKVEAVIYRNGTKVNNKEIASVSVTSTGNIHNFKIDNETILDPGEYIVYYVMVEIEKTNMHLSTLENTASILTLTNINHPAEQGREITKKGGDGNLSAPIYDQNISSKKVSRDYVKLKELIIAGTVWLDVNKNGIMDDGQYFENLKVYLCDGSSNTDTDIISVETDKNGFYTFGRVYKAPQKAKGQINAGGKGVQSAYDTNYTGGEGTYHEYWVEFEYDGLKYKSTEIYGGVAQKDAKNWGYDQISQNSPSWKPSGAYLKDSNAYEFHDIRIEYNERYETIAYNRGRGTLGDVPITYTHTGHESILNEAGLPVDDQRAMRARSFIEKGSNKDKENTKELWIYDNSSGTVPETEYLKYINLGLEEREDFDLSSTKDVFEVKTTINGEQVTYTYDQLKTSDPTGRYESVVEDVNPPAIPKTTNYFSIRDIYKLKLYEADYKYRYDQYQNQAIKDYKGEESELNVEITYKIGILHDKIAVNEPELDIKDIEIDAVINEIVDYYSDNFIDIDSKTTEAMKLFNNNGQLYNELVPVVEAWIGDENGNPISDVELEVSSKSKHNGDIKNIDGFNKSYIRVKGDEGDIGKNGIITLEEGKRAWVYVKYILNKNATRDLDIGQIDNIATIGAFSTYYKNGEAAGLTDRDSNPANVSEYPTKEDFEDDTCRTSIEITAEAPNPEDVPDDPESETSSKPVRILTGQVWDDARSIAKGSGGEAQYIGNGLNKIADNRISNAKFNKNVDELGYLSGRAKSYEDKDIPVQHAKVQIIEIVEVNGKYYEEVLNSTSTSQLEVRTGADGKYKLYGFIPGYYIVRFSYGDDDSIDEMLVFNGQDYKSTQYTAGIEEYTGTYSGRLLYDDDIINALEEKDKNDARDDELMRLQSMSYSETMLNSIAEVLKAPNTYYEDKKGNTDSYTSSKLSEYKKDLISETQMNAETITFHVKPEKLKKDDIALHLRKDGANATYNTFENMIYSYIETRPYSINNIDFGIEYRPESQIALNKVINSIEIVTSDNVTLVKVVIDDKIIDGKVVHVINQEKSIGLENVQFISNEYDTTIPGYAIWNEARQGFVYINIDEEILQGSTINIDYGFTATNESEVDRINYNLDSIRYKLNGSVSNYSETGAIEREIKVYESNTNKVYTAAGTAREALYNEYYEKDTRPGYEGEIYRIKPKTFNDSKIQKAEHIGDGYYGRYLGKIYYYGEVGANDVIGQIKFDKVLDYIDTNLVFETSKNSSEHRRWSTTTSNELLKNGLINKSVFNENNKLANVNGLEYDTTQKSNLVITVDDRISDDQNDSDVMNKSLSRYLYPKVTNKKYINTTEDYDSGIDSYSSGTINLLSSKLISAEALADGDLSYENVAEIIQFSTTTGRRTNFATTIGNADISKRGEFLAAMDESDTSTTEQVTLTPPTGFNGTIIENAIKDVFDAVEENKTGIIISIAVMAVASIGIIIIRVIVQKTKKKRIK